MANEKLCAEVGGDAAGFAQIARVRGHELRSDEPREVGGTDTAPSPKELLCVALGSCTSMTVAMYARRKGFALTHVHVTVTHQQIRREVGEGVSRMVDQFSRVVKLEGNLDAAQRERLLEIANKCPVHLTLANGSLMETTLA